LLATGDCKTQQDAATKVGLARESLGRALRKPHVLEFMRQRALHTIAMAEAPIGRNRFFDLSKNSRLREDH
jgi:hypothetical protein